MASKHGERPRTNLSPIKTLKRVSGQLRDRLRRTIPSSSHALLKPHVLIVDDEESICYSMKEYFAHTGFVVDSAQDVDEAERLIMTGDYAVLIQDLLMGTNRNPNGLEVIRFARRHKPDIRILVLTAHGSDKAESEAKRSGADAFLRKPQRLSQVAEVVRGLVRSDTGHAALH